VLKKLKQSVLTKLLTTKKYPDLNEKIISNILIEGQSRILPINRAKKSVQMLEREQSNRRGLSSCGGTAIGSTGTTNTVHSNQWAYEGSHNCYTSTTGASTGSCNDGSSGACCCQSGYTYSDDSDDIKGSFSDVQGNFVGNIGICKDGCLVKLVPDDTCVHANDGKCQDAMKYGTTCSDIIANLTATTVKCCAEGTDFTDCNTEITCGGEYCSEDACIADETYKCEPIFGIAYRGSACRQEKKYPKYPLSVPKFCGKNHTAPVFVTDATEQLASSGACKLKGNTTPRPSRSLR